MTGYAEVIPGDPTCAITSGLPTIRELVAINAFTRTYAVVPLQPLINAVTGD